MTTLAMLGSTMACLMLSFSFLNLMRYTNARTGLERAIEAASRCLTPTDGECNTLVAANGDMHYDWYGFNSNRNTSYSGDLYHYAATLTEETWEATARGSLVTGGELTLSYPQSSVRTIRGEFGLNQYRRVYSTYQPYRILWHPTVQLPRFDNQIERYCHGRDALGNNVSGGDLSSDLCVAGHRNSQGLALVSLGSQSFSAGPRDSAEFSVDGLVPLLPSAVGTFGSLPASASSVCLKSDGSDCVASWAHAARIAILVSGNISCSDCSRGQTIEVGFDGTPKRSLEVDVYGADRAFLGTVALGGVKARVFNSAGGYLNFNTRGLDGSHGAGIGCEDSGSCGADYSQIVVPRGGSFKVRAKLTNHSNSRSYQATVSFFYAYENYAPDVQSLKALEFPGLRSKQLQEKCENENRLSAQGVSVRGELVCGYVGSRKSSTCEIPVATNASDFEQILPVSKPQTASALLCDGVTQSDFASGVEKSLHLSSDRIICSRKIEPPAFYRVGKVEATPCQKDGIVTPQRVTYACGRPRPTETASSYGQRCRSDLERSKEISAIESQTNVVTALNIKGLLVSGPKRSIEETAWSKTEFTWTKHTAASSSVAANGNVGTKVEFSGSLQRVERADRMAPKASDFVIQPTGSCPGCPDSKDVPADVVVIKKIAQKDYRLSRVYPFESSRISSLIGEGWVPRLPSWANSECSRKGNSLGDCCNLSYPANVTSYDDAIRYFAAYERPELAVRDGRGNYLYALRISAEEGPRRVEFGGVKPETLFGDSKGCLSYSVKYEASVGSEPVFIGTGSPQLPEECLPGGAYEQCFPKKVVSSDDEMPIKVAYNAKRAIEIGRERMGEFVAANFSCGKDFAGCASVDVDTSTGVVASVAASYNLPLLFPFDLFLKKDFIKLEERKSEFLELNAFGAKDS